MPLAFLTWLSNLEWPSSHGECRAESWGAAGMFCAPAHWFTQEAWGKLLRLYVSAHLYSKCSSTYFSGKIFWILWGITGKKRPQIKQINGVNDGQTAKYIWLDQVFFTIINTCDIDFSRLGLHFHCLNEWQVYLSELLTWQIKNLNHTTVVRTLSTDPDKNCKWLQLSFSTQRNRLLSNFHLELIFTKQLTFLLQLMSLITTFKSVYPVNHHHCLILLLRNSNAILVS